MDANNLRFLFELLMSRQELSLLDELRRNPSDQATRMAYQDFLSEAGRDQSASLVGGGFVPGIPDYQKEVEAILNHPLSLPTSRGPFYVPSITRSGAVGSGRLENMGLAGYQGRAPSRLTSQGTGFVGGVLSTDRPPA